MMQIYFTQIGFWIDVTKIVLLGLILSELIKIRKK